MNVFFVSFLINLKLINQIKLDISDNSGSTLNIFINLLNNYQLVNSDIIILTIVNLLNIKTSYTFRNIDNKYPKKTSFDI